LYGLTTRFIFQSDSSSDFLGTLTLGLLLFGPFAVGALTVFLAPQKYKVSWVYAILMPWATCLLLVAALLLLQWEAWICILMAVPFLFVMSSAGGVIICLIFKRRNALRDTNNYMLALFMLSPYLIAPLEHRLPMPDSIRTVETQVVIDASVSTVWSNIISVATIEDQEQHVRFYQLAGLPRPLEATLSHQGIGGMRTAIYEQKLRFKEQIIAWDEQRSLTFTIVPDTSEVGASTLPLKEIGGKYFSPLEATYTLERLPDGKVLLRLSSKHRLSTRFNAYGGLWTDLIMSDLQNDIMQIVKARVEAQAP
jgi:hypothetical protein